MNLEFVSVIFEMCDSLLPVGGENVLVLASKTLVDLGSKVSFQRQGSNLPGFL